MNRTANATILGYNYQFNKSIIEILNADMNTKIMVEGSNEDLDIYTQDKTIAIQCKYYESSESLIPSVLAKPILDMLISYIENKDINFRLYIHYRNSTTEQKEDLDIDLFNNILKTNNKSYIKKYFPIIYNFSNNITKLLSKKTLTNNDIKLIHEYIENNTNKIFKIDINDFISKIEIFSAPSYDSLESEIIQKIVNDGYSKDDAINIFYPNFFQKVATISTKENEKDRIINCKAFKEEIYNLKQLLFTKWLKYIYSVEKYKKAIKNNLKIRLQNNSSIRVIYIDISNYSNPEIASFIVDYIKKYNNKPKLNKCPFFIIEDSSYNNCLEIQTILYNNYNVLIENGDVARTFNLKKFINTNNCSLKICMRSKEIDDYFKENLPNDLFAIGNVNIEELENKGVLCCRIQELNMMDLKEVFYLGGTNK